MLPEFVKLSSLSTLKLISNLDALSKVGEYRRLSNGLKAFHLPTCSGEVHWNIKIESQDYHYLDCFMGICTLKEEVDNQDRSKRNEEVRRDDGDDEEGAADHNDHVDNK